MLPVRCVMVAPLLLWSAALSPCGAEEPYSLRFGPSWKAADEWRNLPPPNAKIFDVVKEGVQPGADVTDEVAARNTGIVRRLLDVSDWDFADGKPSNGNPTTLYFQDGDYVFDDQLEGDAHVRIRGQSRNGTRLILRARAAGFDRPAQPRPFIRVGHGRHDTYGNYLSDFTVTIREGNPGATALQYTGHNCSGLARITVRDEANTARIGFLFGRYPGEPGDRQDTITAVGFFGCADLKAEGFATGIHVRGKNAELLSLKSVRLSNQREQAIYHDHLWAVFSLHDVVSDQAGDVPGLVLDDTYLANTLSFVDVAFDNRQRSQVPAVRITVSKRRETNRANIFLHRAQISSNYARGVEVNGRLLDGLSETGTGTIQQFAQAAVEGPKYVGAIYRTDFDQDQRFIPIPPNPLRYNLVERAEDWAEIPDGASPEQIQAAFNSGKRAVYIGRNADRTATVHWKKPVVIPSTVDVFDGQFMNAKYADSEAGSPDVYLLRVPGRPTDPPLHIRNFSGDGARGDGQRRWMTISIEGGRTVVLQNTWVSAVRTEGAPGVLLVDNLLANQVLIAPGWRLWARDVNLENLKAAVPNHAGERVAVVLDFGEGAEGFVNGMKTEANQPPFGIIRADRRACVSMLGHYATAHRSLESVRYLRTRDARVTVAGTYCAEGGENNYPSTIEETRGTETRTLFPGGLGASVGRPIVLLVAKPE